MQFEQCSVVIVGRASLVDMLTNIINLGKNHLYYMYITFNCSVLNRTKGRTLGNIGIHKSLPHLLYFQLDSEAERTQT